ncbi:phage replisome organizer N-terminal domain-containing protein [Lactococcus formosensis]|uniref:phage replisome organizer N-terminal domain-containing protein n=1 Tax=Lactococcus formosensis TaxID=1281486 RepID=UPI001F061958|nr:phage replisome organizer N-terminal domain-containing protein [Lactococcus formosensis]MCH1723599.1 phage replisome organizer N-terminal domain-containing protein [Lactococcus formosensis]
MADISWIKLSTGLPDNKKIKRIRKLPDGDKVILFWVFLLSRAGESNKSGGLFLTDTMPYQEEDLAADFDFTVEFVQFALITLERYSMIIRYDEVLFIKNWEEYQAIEGMEKIREQNRLRKQRQREREKMMLGHDNMSRDSHADVTASHATEEEIEKEKSKKENKNKKLEPNDLLAEYLNLLLILQIRIFKKRQLHKCYLLGFHHFNRKKQLLGLVTI